MRIIAGTKRGLKLASPKTYDSRPYTDRVKESLFSVLYKFDLIEQRSVADVFSGVGSMGLEALSRGAAFATFVDKDPKTIAVLKQNIEKAGFTDKSKVIRTNAFKTGALVDFDAEKHSIIFVDPPYPLSRNVGPGSQLASLMDVLPEQVAADGIVIVRTHKAVKLLESYGALAVFDERVWGNMAVTFLRLKEND